MRCVAFLQPSWGAEYPKWTNLGVIAISYAVISPLVLGFATVGLGLIYLAYRYNMLYVYDTQIDTKGGFYARALEQLMVGVYLGELCLLGLFGLNIGKSVVSAGPTVMQGVLIIATIVFHIFINRKLKQANLSSHSADFNQRDAEAREEKDNTAATRNSNDSRLSSRTPDQALVSGMGSQVSQQNAHAGSRALTPPSNTPTKRSLIKRIFSPHTLSADQISASLITRFNEPVPPYTREEVLEAYLHPVLTQQQEVIWIAKDPNGVSKTEIAGLKESFGGHGVEATDEGAVMNEKGKVEWNDDNVTQAPLWERKVVY
jgi:hypothetical protein